MIKYGFNIRVFKLLIIDDAAIVLEHSNITETSWQMVSSQTVLALKKSNVHALKHTFQSISSFK